MIFGEKFVDSDFDSRNSVVILRGIETVHQDDSYKVSIFDEVRV